MIWIFLAVYFLVMFGIGAWYSRRQTSAAEFVAANRGLGYWVASFSARATGESGWLILGLSGTGWLIGTPALWVVLGEVLGVAVSWLVIVPRFKREVLRYESLTMLDYFESKLGDTGHRLRWAFASIIVVMVCFYVAGQFTATGTGFAAFFDMAPHTGMLIGAGIVLVYVSLGGFRAVAISDFIQGILMFIGLVAVPVAGIVAAGGWAPIAEAARSADLLTIYPGPEIAAAGGLASPNAPFGLVLGLAGMLAVGLGFLGSPQVYQRIIALDGTKDIGKASAVAIGYTTITGRQPSWPASWAGTGSPSSPTPRRSIPTSSNSSSHRSWPVCSWRSFCRRSCQPRIRCSSWPRRRWCSICGSAFFIRS